MSDEVRSSSTPAPSTTEDSAAPPARAVASESGLAPSGDGPDSEDAISIDVPLPVPASEPEADASTELLPQLSSELSPARHSERPPPPSQRGRAPVRIDSVVATLRPARDDAAPVPIVPPPAPTLGSPSSLPPPASDPVPLVAPKVTTSTPPTSRMSSRPPNLVEPKRIIEVLGSNVPVLDSALDEEEIEDLEADEAHELADTPLPDPDAPSSEPEIELSLEFEDSAPADKADGAAAVPPAEAPNDLAVDGEDAAAEIVAEPDSIPAAPAGQPGPPARRPKVPPNRKRRPPPPSSRIGEKARIEPAPAGRKWWEEMFSEEFLRAIPILSPPQLEREVDFIDESLGVARGGRILDLACGAGQHAVELASRGYDLVGFDLSQSQLDWAGGLAQERGQRLQFTHGDMRDMAYNESFDAVYSWNTSFGFFEEDKNVDIAHRIFRSLRPGGRFLLDVVNRDFVVSQQPGQTWFEGDGCVCIDDVSIDFITSRMKVKRTLMLTSGKNRECTYSVRLYGLHELGKMLHDVGFKVLTVSGRPEMPGVFFGATSPRIIILAAKP